MRHRDAHKIVIWSSHGKRLAAGGLGTDGRLEEVKNMCCRVD
jgi:hypothetical protein